MAALQLQRLLRLRQGVIFSLFALFSLLSAMNNSTEYPVRDTEVGDKTIQWDHYSLMYNEERLWSFSGEFHPFRIPVPEVWEDILVKMKAMGLNTMSFYAHWGIHAATNSTLDFENGAKDLERMYEMCREIGLFVNARPGPYINAELSAGGMPLWATAGEYGDLRNNDPRFRDAWLPYMTEFAKMTAKHQVTQNGTVFMYQLENEYPEQWSDPEKKTPRPGPIEYMTDLYDNAQENGIVVPLAHNMPSQTGKSWSVDYDTVDAGGNVHLYGLDNYPSCWSCNTVHCGGNNPSFSLADYVSHFEQVSPKQPSMMPEFQGGVVNSWDGPPGGCEEKWDESYANFYYRDTIAQRVTILNLYMVYGGTNWGWIGVPFNPTSYGYAAAISENRSLSPKYYEIKNLALFTRCAKDLTKTTRLGSGDSYTNNKAVTATELRNPDTEAGFYVLRHTEVGSTNSENFTIDMETQAGSISIPQLGGSLTLSGNIAKILVTDFDLGGKKLLYSSTEVLTWAMIDGEPTLALWTPDGEDGEFAIQDATDATVVSGDDSKISMQSSGNGYIVNFRDHEGTTCILLDNGVRVFLLGKEEAYRFWAPTLTNDPMTPADQLALVMGPYLVRHAQIQGNKILLSGDSDQQAEIEVVTTKDVDLISWNGVDVATTQTESGTLTAAIGGPESFEAPKIGDWKVKDSLPEIRADYDDSGTAWIDADWMETPSKHKDATKPYLYVDQYGVHNGVHLWRSRFTGKASGASITTQGGVAHGWSAWLNGHFVGSFHGTLDGPRGTVDLSFPDDRVREEENILVIMQDNSGHDQIHFAVDIRGIVYADLIDADGNFDSWKLAGTAGGRSEIDPIRTPYNEGGLTAERLGWHLPSFDDSDWEAGSPSNGFQGAGVRFYRSSLQLETPDNHDMAFSIKLSPAQEGSPTKFRAYLYVNGWQYGKYFPEVNPHQNSYVVPPGILNYDGDNVLGIALWNMDDDIAAVNIGLSVDYVVTSSFDAKFDGDYVRPGWTEDRNKYA